MTSRTATIWAIEESLPESVLSNEDLAGEFSDWDAAKILEKTGIATRHIAGPAELASDLGVAAAESLFRKHAVLREEIDFLIFCTQSPDYFLPTTACTVQSRLGLRQSCGAIDVNQGCSGFVYALALAKGLIETGSADTVLLITADTYSKFINPRDRSVKTLFGDGAAATIVKATENDERLVGPFVFGTDGRGAGNLIVPAGGLRTPRSPGTAVELEDRAGNWRSSDNLFMNGPEIFNFTLRTVPKAVSQLLEKAGLGLDEIDFFVFHQANRFMLETLRDKMKIPASKFCIELETSGNTVSSTIPIAMRRLMERGAIVRGNRLMLVGFGVGYSWAATLVRIQ